MNTAIRRRAPHHMTVGEFIAWVRDGRWQLIDGEPRAMAPAIEPTTPLSALHARAYLARGT